MKYKIILFVIFFITVSIVLSFFGINSAPNNDEDIFFKIVRGENLSSVADNLKEQNLIRSSKFFIALSRLMNLEKNIRVGIYRIRAGTSSLSIARILKDHKQSEVKITIPEGYTASQIARIFDSNSIVDRTSFLNEVNSPSVLNSFGITAKSAEGWLFPSTYYFSPGSDAKAVVTTLIETMFKVLKTIPEASKFTGKKLEEKMILASIVEREYKLASEAPLISSVFTNRLKANIALESCATVVYVITERLLLPHPIRIYDRDLSIPDPYNTYRQRGLPPGSISSPGLTALKAAFNPSKSDYYFFRLINSDTGEHYFSRNLKEHIDASDLYIKKVGG